MLFSYDMCYVKLQLTACKMMSLVTWKNTPKTFYSIAEREFPNSFLNQYFNNVKNLFADNLRAFNQLIPLFHTGPESHELTRIDKYLYSWLNRTQFVMVLTDSHSP